jgi:hypothetical protein
MSGLVGMVLAQGTGPLLLMAGLPTLALVSLLLPVVMVQKRVQAAMVERERTMVGLAETVKHQKAACLAQAVDRRRGLP